MSCHSRFTPPNMPSFSSQQGVVFIRHLAVSFVCDRKTCLSFVCCSVRYIFLWHADREMDNELPPHAYTNNYGPDFRLHIPVRTGKENLNSPERIAKLREALLQEIRR